MLDFSVQLVFSGASGKHPVVVVSGWGEQGRSPNVVPWAEAQEANAHMASPAKDARGGRQIREAHGDTSKDCLFISLTQHARFMGKKYPLTPTCHPSARQATPHTQPSLELDH